jgi:hypothetical protein
METAGHEHGEPALMSPCAECGYDYDALDRAAVLVAVPALAREHCSLLAAGAAERLRAHPRPASWSALEYGCHVRDMLVFQRERVILAQAEDTPAFVSMGRDERAVQERYNEQDPAVVARELAAAATELTVTLGALKDAGWRRTGLCQWPEPAIRTVEWIGRRTAHELAHHLFDERRLLS